MRTQKTTHVEHRTPGEILRDLDALGLRPLTEGVAKHYQVTVQEMLGPSHEHAPASARRVLWSILYGTDRYQPVQIARAYNPSLRATLRRTWSYPALGQMFGRDHSTIMIGVSKTKVKDVEETLRSFDGWEAA